MCKKPRGDTGAESSANSHYDSVFVINHLTTSQLKYPNWKPGTTHHRATFALLMFVFFSQACAKPCYLRNTVLCKTPPGHMPASRVFENRRQAVRFCNGLLFGLIVYPLGERAGLFRLNLKSMGERVRARVLRSTGLGGEVWRTRRFGKIDTHIKCDV